RNTALLLTLPIPQDSGLRTQHSGSRQLSLLPRVTARMRRLLPLALALAGCTPATKPVIQPPSAFLDAGPRPKLMFLGTFHFANPGLDSYKPKYDIDIFEPQRQKEVEELAGHLARFKPTKVAVEAQADRIDAVNQRYRDYLAGKYE